MSLMSLNLSFWGLQTLAMLLTAILIPGLRVTSIFGAFSMVLALGFVNSHYWDASLFFSLPSAFSIKAAGLLVMNALIFFVLTKILPGIEITRISSALFAPVVFTVVNLFLNKYSSHIDWKAVADFILMLLSQAKAWLQ
jgi:putative membrane protein